MRIAHISDTHIRNLKYHEEYKIVFQNIYEQLEMDHPDIIIHCGDLAHTKTQLSPEYFALAADFLSKLADIAPLYIIAGNHDGNLKNGNRLDAITPIVEALNHPGINFLLDSGETHVDDNICLNVLSVFDRDNWVKPTDYSKVNIALYHGSIKGSKVGSDWSLENGEDDVSIFAGFDYAMLGDIHRMQFLDNECRVAYCGSTVQQNFGESLLKGYLLWDVRGKESHSVEKRFFMSPRPFYTVEINQDGTLPNVEVPKNARLRLVSHYNLPLAKLRRACDYARTKWSAYTVNFVNKAGYSDGGLSVDGSEGRIINMRDPSTQEDYIRRFLSDKEATDDVLDRVVELNNNYNKQLEESEEISRNIIWKIKKMKWNNLFNYGEGNEINFANLNGLVGIFGKNYSGKSSIIDAALFGMFNTTSKSERKNVHLINQNKDKSRIQLEIGVGNDSYKITRTLEAYEKKSKGAITREAKTDLDFTKYALGTMAESKNGTTRNETDSNIRKTFGSFEDFMITSMSSQTDSFGFINEGSTKRKEILAKFLDLQVFEVKHKLAKKDSSELKGIIKHLGAVDWNKKMVHNTEALQEIFEEIDGQQDKCSTLTERCEELRQEISIVEDQIASVGEEWIDISILSQELQSKQDNMSEILSSLEAVKLEIASNISDRETLESRNCEVQIEELREQLDTINAMSSDLRQAVYDLKSTKTKIKSFEKKINLLHDHEYDPDCEYCNNNSFVQDAIEARQSLPALQRKESQLESLINSKRAMIQRLDEGAIKLSISSYESNERNIEKSKTEAMALESRMESLKSQRSLLMNEISSLQSKKSHYYDNQEAYDNHDSLRRDLTAMQKMLKDRQISIKACEKKMMSLRTEEGATQQLIREAQDKLDEIQKYERDYIAYDLFIQAMHPNGVSYQVIKSMLSIINSEISSILNSIVEFEVFFDNIGDKLEIYIKHPKYDPRPLSMGSGAEKTLASMAIRLALISITNLPKAEIFVMDEPATALDAEHMDGFIRLLQMIKSQFKTVLLISHLDSLKDVVDMTIDIQKKDGYAHVQI
jgi:exonuclease SbcC